MSHNHEQRYVTHYFSILLSNHSTKNTNAYYSSANAAPEFEGRGGEDLATSLSAMLQRVYSSPHTLNTASLCVVPGKRVKALCVDIEVCGVFTGSTSNGQNAWNQEHILDY